MFQAQSHGVHAEPHPCLLFMNTDGVRQLYLSVLDLQRAAAGVDVCSVERRLGPLGALHRVKCNDGVKDNTGTVTQ